MNEQQIYGESSPISSVTGHSHLPDAEPAADVRDELGEGPDDLFHYGWRERRSTVADGSEKLRYVPLTYRDLLSPEEGDYVAESTIHRDVTEQIASILKRRFADAPGVAVWRNLKLAFVIPELTTGPGPDLCVVEGVVDRDRDRGAFAAGRSRGRSG